MAFLLLPFSIFASSVKIENSSGSPISGATVKIYDSGWQTLSESNPGEFPYPAGVSPNVTVRVDLQNMRFQKSGVSTSGDHTISTIAVNTRLLSSGGAGLSGGTVKSHRMGWNTHGSTDASGSIIREMLPGTYTFRIDYDNGREQRGGVVISAGGGSSQEVIFNTINVSTKLISSGGSGLNGGTVKSHKVGWRTHGMTNLSGVVDREMLPGTYTFRMDYENGRQQIGGIMISSSNGFNQEVVFNTVGVQIKLETSDNLALAGGVVKSHRIGWKTHGPTSSSGLVEKEMLPGTYTFRMDYQNGRQQIGGVEIFQNPSVQSFEFNTVTVNTKLISSLGAGLDGGTPKSHRIGWYTHPVTVNGESVREMLPGTYTFRMDYNNGRQQIGGILIPAYVPSINVVFNTIGVTTSLHASTSGGGAGLSGATVKTHRIGWRTHGQTDNNGEQFQEMLPGTYTFRMDYENGRQQIGGIAVSNSPSSQTVPFTAMDVHIHLQTSDNAGLAGGTPKTHRIGWRTQAQTDGNGVTRVNMLPGTYTFRMDYNHGREQRGGVSVYDESGDGRRDVYFTTTTTNIRVEYQTGDGIDQAETRHHRIGWSPVQLAGCGDAIRELLPGNYTFRVRYNNQNMQLGGVGVSGSDQTVSFTYNDPNTPNVCSSAISCIEDTIRYKVTSAFRENGSSSGAGHSLWIPNFFYSGQTARFSFDADAQTYGYLDVALDGSGARLHGVAKVYTGGVPPAGTGQRDFTGSYWVIDIPMIPKPGATPKIEQGSAQPLAVTDLWRYFEIVLRPNPGQNFHITGIDCPKDCANLTQITGTGSNDLGVQTGYTANGKNLGYGLSTWFDWDAWIDKDGNNHCSNGTRTHSIGRSYHGDINVDLEFEPCFGDCPPGGIRYAMSNYNGGNGDHGMWMPNYFSNGQTARWKWKQDEAFIDVFDDGTARAFGIAEVQTGGPLGTEFYFDLSFGAPNPNTGPKIERANIQPQELRDTWEYFLLVEDQDFEMFELFGNRDADLSRRPADGSKGLQIGAAANNKDADFGASTWFFYDKYVNYSLTSTSSNHGDLNVDLEAECDDRPHGNCVGNSIVSANQGVRINGSAVPLDRSDVTRALGAPQGGDAVGSFYSLGMGGDIVIHFGGPVANLSGNDIRLTETSYGDPSCSQYPEHAELFASQDGTNWTSLGVNCLDGEYDLGTMEWAFYFKVVDVSPSNYTGGNGDGFDVDGIECLNGPYVGVSEPSSVNRNGSFVFVPDRPVQNVELLEGVQNVSTYPNPFSNTISFSYDLIGNSKVEISIMDVLGNEVDRIIPPAGTSTAEWIPRAGIEPGIYFYAVEAGEQVEKGKIIKK